MRAALRRTRFVPELPLDHLVAVSVFVVVIRRVARGVVERRHRLPGADQSCGGLRSTRSRRAPGACESNHSASLPVAMWSVFCCSFMQIE